MRKKRTEALQRIADALNFSFERKGDELLLAMHNNFDLFSKGRLKKISNVMHGNSGDMDITIMDYKYTVGSGKNSTTYSQTLIVVQSKYLQLPSFTLSPENIFHKIGGISVIRILIQFTSKILKNNTCCEAMTKKLSEILSTMNFSNSMKKIKLWIQKAIMINLFITEPRRGLVPRIFKLFSRKV